MLLLLSVPFCFFFFFKQKTAYEMRISDWSSDVCSSDLDDLLLRARRAPGPARDPDCRLRDRDDARHLYPPGESDPAPRHRPGRSRSARRVLTDAPERHPYGLSRRIGNPQVIENNGGRTWD